MSPAGRHTVKLHGIVVGYSELEHIDPVLGVARGRFRPGVGYDLVQPVFRLFTEAVPDAGGPVADEQKLARYHRSRDALSLLLEDDAGQPVSTSAIHISDYSHLPEGGMELEVLIPDRAYWGRRSNSP
jgi:hypothetical protein